MRKIAIVIYSMTVAMGVVAVFVPQAAQAVSGLPTVSPSAATNKTDAISISKPTYNLSNGNNVECGTSSVGSSEETKSPAALGSFKINFKECVGHVSGLSAKCTGLSQSTTGEIESTGEYHLVYDTAGTELGVAILFLVATTHFTCAGLFLNIVSGEQACLIKEPYVEKTLAKMVCEQTKNGEQKEIYFNDAGTEVHPKLTVHEGESETAISASEVAEALLLFLNAKAENVKSLIKMT